MTLLIIGLATFSLVHLLPSVPALRSALRAKLGEKGYRGAFSLISLASFALLVWGFIVAPNDSVREPATWARHLALAVMPLVFILLASNGTKTPLKRFIPHPMTTGVLLWAGLHYLANGEARSAWLFGTFLLLSAVQLLSRFWRPGDPKPDYSQRALVTTVIAGLILYVVFLFAHPYLFGVSPLYG